MFESINSKNINIVALFFVGIAIFLAVQLHLSPQTSGWRAVLGGATLSSLMFALFNYKRLLKMTEAPTSTIAAAAQGYIELHGVASTLKPLKTPYQGIPCVWYRAYAYANTINAETNKPDNRLLSFSQSEQVFQLQDESGTCAVNPQGAEVIFLEKHTQYKNDHRYVEEYLPVGKPLYLIGYLDTLHHYNTEHALQKDTTDLLIAWKKNQSQLHARFDKNRSGDIDLDEWEVARREARREVEASHHLKANHQMMTLSKPKQNQLFLISALSPQALRQQYRLWSGVHLVIFLILTITYLKIE